MSVDHAAGAEDIAEPITEQALVEFAKSLPAFLEAGGKGFALLGIDPDGLEAIYAQAFNLYERERYTDASQLFAFLTFSDHTDLRFVFGMGSCEQMLGRYPEAIHWFAFQLAMDMCDPAPTYRIAECLVGMGKIDDALETLQIVLDLTVQPKHAALRQRTLAMRQLLTGGTGDEMGRPI